MKNFKLNARFFKAFALLFLLGLFISAIAIETGKSRNTPPKSDNSICKKNRCDADRKEQAKEPWKNSFGSVCIEKVDQHEQEGFSTGGFLPRR